MHDQRQDLKSNNFLLFGKYSKKLFRAFFVSMSQAKFYVSNDFFHYFCVCKRRDQMSGWRNRGFKIELGIKILIGLQSKEVYIPFASKSIILTNLHIEADDIFLHHIFNNRSQNTKEYDFKSYKLKTKH